MSARSAYLVGVDVLTAHHEPAVEVEDAAIVQQMTSVPNVDGGRTVDGGGEPLQGLRPFVPVETPVALADKSLKSELPDVSDEAWTKFALAMKTASPGDISASHGYGMFELKARRLVDLKLMENATNKRSSTGRMVWSGDWIAPLSESKFLSSASAQYRAFGASMRRYVDGLRDGTIPRPQGGRPDGMTLSGVLAVLHRCGPSGLKTWNDENDRFPETVALYERANGIF